jgi:heme-degrading monooxygenase HmoA
MANGNEPEGCDAYGDEMTSTPEPPYLAVIFTSHRAGRGEGPIDRGYDEAADRMEHLAETIPGYLGIESVRSSDGTGITVSYWADESAIEAWRQHPEHLDVQARGRREWYDWYEIRVARVERSASFAS